jgi:hypothetical protein
MVFPHDLGQLKYECSRVGAPMFHLCCGKARGARTLSIGEVVPAVFKFLESLLAAKKLGRLINQLLPDYSDPLNFNQLRDDHGNIFEDEAAVDKAASRIMSDWMGCPQASILWRSRWSSTRMRGSPF